MPFEFCRLFGWIGCAVGSQLSADLQFSLENWEISHTEGLLITESPSNSAKKAAKFKWDNDRDPTKSFYVDQLSIVHV